MEQQSPSEIASKLAEAGHEWADKEAAASLLEETRKSVRAQLACEYIEGAGSAAKAELLAEADQRYTEHLTAMVEARKQANVARVNYDSGKIWTEMVRTAEATKRAELQMR